MRNADGVLPQPEDLHPVGADEGILATFDGHKHTRSVPQTVTVIGPTQSSQLHATLSLGRIIIFSFFLIVNRNNVPHDCTL